VAQASFFQAPQIMHFGIKFEPSSCIAIGLLFAINAIQAIGDFTATTTGSMDREPTDKELKGAIVGYGCMNVVGAFLGGLPTASYSQNVGIVTTTKVINRVVLGMGAGILLIAGLVPKFSALLTTIPQCVLGGATISVFASIAMTGIKLITTQEMNFRNTYYTLLMLDEQLEISRQTADTWKETVESTQALMDAGQADEAAVSQMRATYYEVENSVMDLEEQINQVENSLSLLLAETPHKIARGKLSGQQFTSRLSVGVPLQMLSNRPDVRMAERDLEQAFYVTNQANSAFYPSITLSGSAGWTNSVGGLITNPGKFVTSALASLTQPLFNRGTLIARRRIAKAQQEEALLAFEQKLLDAGTEVNEALVSYQISKRKKDNYENQVAALEKAFTSTSLLMQHGNTTYLEVLTARQTLLNAQLSQTANCFKEIQSLINLYQALGGGQHI